MTVKTLPYRNKILDIIHVQPHNMLPLSGSVIWFSLVVLTPILRWNAAWQCRTWTGDRTEQRDLVSPDSSKFCVSNKKLAKHRLRDVFCPCVLDGNAFVVFGFHSLQAMIHPLVPPILWKYWSWNSPANKHQTSRKAMDFVSLQIGIAIPVNDVAAFITWCLLSRNSHKNISGRVLGGSWNTNGASHFLPFSKGGMCF